ncbi:hypothetical protein HX780_27960 [Pseudomonas tolaasii]|uniref:hypothetical protein n=1 Tax=Pseudomonas tolaasii TaxID=29442 RepID=UPI0015A251B8|nr:hypothetical protein [Pseudomonas tolaasii]NVZ46732.1 hypothetical protein [Pseudomonas tolaasii]NWA52141.1 hypothetical protein [Pseudomonas tolaasii]WLH53952.1 hypothetical protein PSH62_10180 [Pseudomonas tolaasii]
MNYLEEEINEAFIALKIDSRQLAAKELIILIKALTKTFFQSESHILDPVELNEKNTEHNPNFWKEVHQRIHEKDLILLVFDSTYSAWEIKSSEHLVSILGETTGFPFWVTDSNLTFLVHMDDHDCVIWA